MGVEVGCSLDGCMGTKDSVSVAAHLVPPLSPPDENSTWKWLPGNYSPQDSCQGPLLASLPRAQRCAPCTWCATSHPVMSGRPGCVSPGPGEAS